MGMRAKFRIVDGSHIFQRAGKSSCRKESMVKGVVGTEIYYKNITVMFDLYLSIAPDTEGFSAVTNSLVR